MSLLHSRRSMRIKRVTPRIISRSYGVKLKRTEGCSDVTQNGKNSDFPEPIVPNDVEEELQSKICIKGGVVVSTTGSQYDNNNAKYCNYLQSGSSDCFTPIKNADIQFVNSEVEKGIRLPGVADEVESYPCPICGPDKVFLTVSGLERHAQEIHPQNLQNVRASIDHIQNEWSRRRNQRLASMRQQFRRSEESMSLGRNSTIIVMKRNPNVTENAADHNLLQYEVCKLCGTMISTVFPGVMEKHIQAHKKNNELRQHLMQEFGRKFVDSLTCKECSLVFSDERKLADHFQINHVKRRRFVCRWCGKMFQTIADLNCHKQNIHNISTNLPKYGVYTEETNVNINESKCIEGNESESSLEDIQQRTVRVSENFNDSPVDECTPCRTRCRLCGLDIIKPSLLLRHMLRVHNQLFFDAEIESQYKAPLRFSISSNGRVTWICCDEYFTSRESVLMHRRLMHGSYCAQTMSSSSTVENSTEQNHLRKLNNASESKDSEVHVIVLEDELQSKKNNEDVEDPSVIEVSSNHSNESIIDY